VDIYLESGTSNVTVQSGATSTNATTLTLANGAKISGLTGADAIGDATPTTTTGSAALGITGIVAVTGTADVADAGNYLGIASTATNGTITATANGGAKNYSITIATLTSNDGT
jgi:hypothetical protein